MKARNMINLQFWASRGSSASLQKDISPFSQLFQIALTRNLWNLPYDVFSWAYIGAAGVWKQERWLICNLWAAVHLCRWTVLPASNMGVLSPTQHNRKIKVKWWGIHSFGLNKHLTDTAWLRRSDLSAIFLGQLRQQCIFAWDGQSWYAPTMVAQSAPRCIYFY